MGEEDEKDEEEIKLGEKVAELQKFSRSPFIEENLHRSRAGHKDKLSGHTWAGRNRILESLTSNSLKRSFISGSRNDRVRLSEIDNLRSSESNKTVDVGDLNSAEIVSSYPLELLEVTITLLSDIF